MNYSPYCTTEIILEPPPVNIGGSSRVPSIHLNASMPSNVNHLWASHSSLRQVAYCSEKPLSQLLSIFLRVQCDTVNLEWHPGTHTKRHAWHWQCSQEAKPWLHKKKVNCLRSTVDCGLPLWRPCHFKINESSIKTIAKKKKERETHEAIVAAMPAGTNTLYFLWNTLLSHIENAALRWVQDCYKKGIPIK